MPDLVLLHGFPFDSSMWVHQLVGIRGHRVIAPDLRGFGSASLGDEPVSMATYADDVVSLLDELGIATVVLGGLSMGGYIALEFARRHRDRLRGLVLMDTKATADTAEGKAGRDKSIDAAQQKGADAIAESMAPKLFANDVEPAVRDSLLATMRRAGVPAMVAAIAAMRDRSDNSDRLAELGGLPTLVIVGSEDRITPLDDAQFLAEGIPGAELLVIEGAGHVPPLERPEAVNAALQRYLDGLV